MVMAMMLSVCSLVGTNSYQGAVQTRHTLKLGVVIALVVSYQIISMELHLTIAL